MFARACLTFVVAVTAPLVQAAEQGRFQTEGQIIAQLQLIDGYDGWGNGEAGKFVDGTTEYFWQADVDLSYQLTDTLAFEGALTSSATEFSAPLGVTEAFLRWRPVPASRLRHAVKVGSFYPPISLENTDTGWQSPFTTSFSAINTWIAEEVRVMGIELEHTIRTDVLGGRDRFKLRHALFVGNDPAGSMLAWKGWSVHQRQSHIGEELALAPLLAFEPGQPFEAQADHVDPFFETDDQLGHYASVDWNRGSQFLLRFSFYDNRADPEALREGQYGWRTRFYALGFTTHWAGFDVITQALKGDTRMGPRSPDRNAVDNTYESAFLLVSRNFNKHRVTLRRDWFEVHDRDVMARWDPNQESGAAWTVSYAFALTDHCAIETEWVSIDTRRAAWAMLGEPVSRREEQVRIGFRYRL